MERALVIPMPRGCPVCGACPELIAYRNGAGQVVAILRCLPGKGAAGGDKLHHHAMGANRKPRLAFVEVVYGWNHGAGDRGVALGL